MDSTFDINPVATGLPVAPETPMNELPIPLARLLQESPNGWLLVDERGVIAFSNLRATELFGYTAEELLGQPIELLTPENVREQHVRHREKYMQSPALRPMGLGLEHQHARAADAVVVQGQQPGLVVRGQ